MITNGQVWVANLALNTSQLVVGDPRVLAQNDQGYESYVAISSTTFFSSIELYSQATLTTVCSGTSYPPACTIGVNSLGGDASGVLHVSDYIPCAGSLPAF